MSEPTPLEYIEQLLDEQRFDEAESLLLEQLDRQTNLAAVYNALAIISIESYQDYRSIIVKRLPIMKIHRRYILI